MRDLPVWLLDVDGVLNATSKPGWHAPPTRRYAYANGAEFSMRWAPSLLDRIRTLIRTEQVEVRWATSWIGYTAQLERMFGLPPLIDAFRLDPALLAGTEERRQATEANKRAAALEIVRSGRRLLWTDDDAIWPNGPERDELTAAGALLIAPDERRGLQPDHLDAIDAWLQVTR